MTDPLEALRDRFIPVDPDQAFAARLRDRLERLLLTGSPAQTEEDEMTDTEQTVTSVLNPYIAVSDARRALDWYEDVLGGHRRGEPYVMPDNRIGHAEVVIGNAVLMLADEFPESGHVGPRDPSTRSFSLHLRVPEVDELTRRAQAAGATVEREPEDQPYGRVSAIIDPFGHRWMLNGPVR
jgi:uncharacterized glyoxalase superfamily protein PhnB